MFPQAKKIPDGPASNSHEPCTQFAHGGPAINAVIRQSPEDFRVIERLGFAPDGNGEHDFLWIEKRNCNSEWVARQLAHHASLTKRDVGMCGQKDRHAVTRQWFSVRRPTGAGTNWQTFSADGVTIIDVARNRRKLRPGAHSGNEFAITLRSTSGDRAGLPALLRNISNLGVPNYFGEQRFGRAGHNMELARQYFSGQRLRREQRSFAISAARAWMFNRQLTERVENGTWNRILDGEIVALDGSGSTFLAEIADSELQGRCDSLDVHPTAELWGSGSDERNPGVVVAPDDRWIADGLSRHAKPTRRALRLAVRDLSMTEQDGAIRLDFYLARGGFATAVLREIANYRDAARQSGSSST